MMPNFNRWIEQYALLTDYYAVSHPSLPNYLALIGGETFGIHSDCFDCFLNAPSLPDELEASGRTWKDYQEDMPAPCALGHNGKMYTQVIDPFVYFDPIRLNPDRCDQDVLPLTRLDQDLSQGSLPDFVFITPNLCNDAHRCELDVTDRWLAAMITKLTNSKSYDSHSLIVITFDEGATNASCCGLGLEAGGHIATLLISPLVKTGFEDGTPYSHYSLLKTIETSWGLPLLGHTADAQTNLIASPWGK
jgi:acid phosphatase